MQLIRSVGSLFLCFIAGFTGFALPATAESPRGWLQDSTTPRSTPVGLFFRSRHSSQQTRQHSALLPFLHRACASCVVFDVLVDPRNAQ